MGEFVLVLKNYFFPVFKGLNCKLIKARVSTVDISQTKR